MKIAVRLLTGIAGLFIIVLGLRQMRSGLQELAGVPVAFQPGDLGDPIALPEQGCSIRVPKGWERRDAVQGGVMFISPKQGGASANIVVAGEPFAGSLREYADANINAVKAAMAAVQMEEDNVFPLESGAPSFKVTFRNKLQGTEVSQAMYFFDGPPGKKIVVSANAPAVLGAGYAPLFDGCLKTLVVLPPVDQ